MTSAINYNGIDGSFPVAGQDNDSQGFRENFSYIKNGLSIAALEITELQAQAILKGPVGGADGETVNNDFGFSAISNVIIKNGYPYAINQTVPTNSITLDLSEGFAHHKYVVDNTMQDLTIEYANWPKDPMGQSLYVKLRLELTRVGASLTPCTVWFLGYGISKVITDDTLPFAGVDLPLTSNESVILDMWTTDGGKTLYASKVGTFSEKTA